MPAGRFLRVAALVLVARLPCLGAGSGGDADAWRVAWAARVLATTGQDAACISEASVGITRMEVAEGGGLYAAVTLPNLILGTVGGGTALPTARECLRILDCDGADRASRLAEICAAVTLAGELSIVAALCSGDFARAPATLGRKQEPGT